MACVKPPESYRDLVDRPLISSFVTARSNGAPQAHPMWFMWDDAAERLKLTHTNTRQMYRFLQRDPRVGLLIIDPDNMYRYMQFRGEVESIVPDPEGAFYQQLQVRYRGTSTPPPDAPTRVVLTIAPSVIIARAAGSQPIIVGKE